MPAKKVPKINLYRNISISFIVFTAMLLCAVFLAFYNEALIIVTAEPQEIDLNFNAEVKAEPTIADLAEKDVLAGSLAVVEKTGEGDFAVKSTKTVSSAIVGQVKIVNNSTRNQPLVKTTQLQAANGVIVRTNETVTVPAGGDVSVDVYPKEPESFQAIAPGNLTIIKLSPSLQDKIYGVANKTMSTDPREVKILSESDINKAKTELSAQLAEAVKKELGLKESDQITPEIVSFKTDKKAGDETDTFKLTMAVKAKYLQFDQNQLMALVNKKINNLNLTGLAVGDITPVNLIYTIVDDNLAGSVLIKVNYLLSAKLGLDSPVLDKQNLAGKSIEVAKEYLSQSDLIKDAQITVSPYWRKSLPKQADKIRIIIK